MTRGLGLQADSSRLKHPIRPCMATGRLDTELDSPIRTTGVVCCKIRKAGTTMKRVLILAMFSACPGPSGGTLVLEANPKVIPPDGSVSRVAITATRSNSTVGSGLVTISSTVGSLGTKSATLDSFGSATVDASCDVAVDTKCQQSFVVSATWEGVTETVSIRLLAAGGGTAGGGAGGGGATAGGSAAVSPCADGTRDGLDATRLPNVAACSGSFAGAIDEASAQSLCGAGWGVCTGTSPALSQITTGDTTGTPGCFAYDAANDCGVCFPTCRGAVGTTRMGCVVPNNPMDPDMSALGATCPFRLTQTSCLPASTMRTDASQNSTGCVYTPQITGVLCCRR